MAIKSLGGRTVYTKQFYSGLTGALWDPPVVLFEQKKPDTTIIEWRYGVDAELTRNSLGEYQVEVPWTQAGTWYVRWQALADEADIDSAMGGVEEEVTVPTSAFTAPILPNS